MTAMESTLREAYWSPRPTCAFVGDAHDQRPAGEHQIHARASRRVSAFSIASETSCAKAAMRSSVPGGSGTGAARGGGRAGDERAPDPAADDDGSGDL